jgi:hypothetical protein
MSNRGFEISAAKDAPGCKQGIMGTFQPFYSLNLYTDHYLFVLNYE